MNKTLTKKELEKCVNLLNWKYKTDKCAYWYVDESGEVKWREWEEGCHKGISLTDALFHSLWNKLEELTKYAGFHLEYIPVDDKPYCVAIKYPDSRFYYKRKRKSNPCLALAEAIENLKKGYIDEQTG